MHFLKPSVLASILHEGHCFCAGLFHIDLPPISVALGHPRAANGVGDPGVGGGVGGLGGGGAGVGPGDGVGGVGAGVGPDLGHSQESPPPHSWQGTPAAQFCGGVEWGLQQCPPFTQWHGAHVGVGDGPGVVGVGGVGDGGDGAGAGVTFWHSLVTLHGVVPSWLQ